MQLMHALLDARSHLTLHGCLRLGPHLLFGPRRYLLGRTSLGFS